MPRAVIVDDDPALGELFAAVLTMAGFETILVADSRQAMTTIRTGMPDIVTLDLQMPHISGGEVLRMLRSDDTLRSIRVIVVSANAQAVQQENIDDIADIILMKPVSYSQLSELANRLLPAQPASGDQTANQQSSEA